MKESTTIEKPQLVENFVQNLMFDGFENNDTICFDKVSDFRLSFQSIFYMLCIDKRIFLKIQAHFQHCLVKLASEAMAREQSCFTGYEIFCFKKY